jgi:hypothetical protein
VLVTPACPSTWQARLSATVAGTTATGVTASISGGSGPSSVAMTAAGGVWTALVNLPAGQQLSWTATATTAAGRLRSASKVLHYDCVP